MWDDIRLSYEYDRYCLNPKWQRIWMWVSILILGPAAFMAGLGTGRRAVGMGGNAQTASMSNANNGAASGIKSNLVFLKSNGILRSSDPSRCVQPKGGGSTEEEYYVCLNLQSNGNLLLFEQLGERSTVLWKSQISLSPGDYWTRLQGDGNLVTSRGTDITTADARSIVWDSRSPSMDADYFLVWDAAEKGMQIVRMQDGERVVLWSTTSTWGTEEDLGDWQPAPIASMPFAPSPSATVISPPQESPPEESIFIPDWEDEGATPKPWFSAATSTRYSMRSGPLVGHTTDRTVRLWALQGQNQVMELAYRQVGASVGYSLAMPPNADQGAAILEVTDLQPNAQYEYQVRIQGETVGEGVWKTASPSNLPTSFKFLLASCMDVKSNRHPLQPVWDRVLEQGMPDFAILNGDTVYLNDDDWTSTNEIILERVWYRNLAQRDESHFRNFISKVPTYTTWDDHEYGANNSNKNQPGKYNSLRAFNNLWANPYAGTSSVEGVFYSFYRGDVHFIVCDNRWYRDPATGSQFGQEQMKWISSQLQQSGGVFKILVSGGDVMERGMSKDADDIGRIVTQHRISGVLFCAGDIHRNEFKAMDNEFWPYKLTQITSSGIAREWRRPWAIVDVDTTITNPVVRANFYGAESTAPSTTWGNDPNLRCSSIVGVDRYAEHRCTETIQLSDLTP